MKRNMDLVRRMLLEMESQPAGSDGIVSTDGCDPREVVEHKKLLIDAGLVHVEEIEEWHRPTYRKPHVRYRLTWEGHEFLEAARDPERWEAGKEIAKSQGAGMMFGVLKGILERLAVEALKQYI